jgi:hypothetical protein
MSLRMEAVYSFERLYPSTTIGSHNPEDTTVNTHISSLQLQIERGSLLHNGEAKNVRILKNVTK